MNKAGLFAIQVIKTHTCWRKAQVDSAGWAITLFGYNQFGDILLIFRKVGSLFGRLIYLFAVNKGNDVSILFKSA